MFPYDYLNQIKTHKCFFKSKLKSEINFNSTRKTFQFVEWYKTVIKYQILKN